MLHERIDVKLYSILPQVEVTLDDKNAPWSAHLGTSELFTITSYCLSVNASF